MVYSVMKQNKMNEISLSFVVIVLLCMFQVVEECLSMLNEGSRVQHILQAVDQWPSPHMRLALCQLCHNLLLSQKLAIHNFR